MGECFFWYRPTRVVPDQRPLNGRRLGHRTLLVARKIRFSCPKYKEKLVRASNSREGGTCLMPGDAIGRIADCKLQQTEHAADK